MKRFAIAAAFAALLATPALAEVRSIEVPVPANLSDPAVAAQYVSDVRVAAETVCRRAAAPVAGPGYWAFAECVRDTVANVAAADTTGLISAELKAGRSFQIAQK
jgi:UrcA family protein